MLLIIVNSQKKDNNGIDDKNPFLKIILRENLRIYKALPPKNIIEDQSPCAIINIRAPATPIWVKYITPPIVMPIWATEE